jgi:hypothetical protein
MQLPKSFIKQILLVIFLLILMAPNGHTRSPAVEPVTTIVYEKRERVKPHPSHYYQFKTKTVLLAERQNKKQLLSGAKTTSSKNEVGATWAIFILVCMLLLPIFIRGTLAAFYKKAQRSESHERRRNRQGNVVPLRERRGQEQDKEEEVSEEKKKAS